MAFSKIASSEIVYYGISKCPLGLMLVGQTQRGVCAVLFGDNTASLRSELTRRFPHYPLEENTPKVEESVEQLRRFLQHPQEALNLPMDMHGTEFQKAVWRQLCEIPVGQTATYTDIARRLGKPKAVRAVAGACAANHISVAIPCHRVLRKDGSLGGYYWGIERKKVLLDSEQLAISN